MKTPTYKIINLRRANGCGLGRKEGRKNNMKYWIITTGQGMLPAGKKIGEVDATNIDNAKRKIAQQVGDTRAEKWDYILQIEDRP